MEGMRSSRFAKAGVDFQGSCPVKAANCEKCGAELKKDNSSCGCATDMVCPSCGHCNYCHGTKKCQEECCNRSAVDSERPLQTKCKVCMDTGVCQQCLYR
ncbi:MAG TPA: hypothetical protein VGK23_00800 [Methanomassiliicoccales archaeon]